MISQKEDKPSKKSINDAQLAGIKVVANKADYFNNQHSGLKGKQPI